MMRSTSQNPHIQKRLIGTERAITLLLGLCAALSVVTTVGIVGVLLIQGIGFFREVPLRQFLFDTAWTPLFSDKHFGVAPLVAGTLLTTMIAMGTALPLGLLSAVYLSEFASPVFRRYVKPLLEILAAVPTVVYGYFALTMVTPLFKVMIPSLSSFNALSAGLVMGIMILPLIASISEDALFAVPRQVKEGAYALGATPFDAIFRVIVPSAASGIAAAFILGLSRAVGETMIVAIAAGLEPKLTLDPRSPVETMTAYIVQVSLGDTPTGTVEYKTIFAVGLTLFVFTLLLNFASYRLRRRWAH